MIRAACACYSYKNHDPSGWTEGMGFNEDAHDLDWLAGLGLGPSVVLCFYCMLAAGLALHDEVASMYTTC